MKSPTTLPHIIFDHLTINTAHNCQHTNYAVHESHLPFFKPLTLPGGHCFTHPDSDLCQMQILHTKLQPGHSVLTIFSDHGIPAITCHLCLDISLFSVVWTHAITAHRETAQRLPHNVPQEIRATCAAMPYVRRPDGLFITVHFQPGLFLLTLPQMTSLGSFEAACFYTFWLNHHGLI